VGINSVRLEVKSGIEDTYDAFAQYKIDRNRDALKAERYTPVNDNNDPFVINPNGFQWTQLDETVEKLVLPMKALVEANGEQLYINLNYVDFEAGSFEHYANPEEYAEFVLAVFQHLDSQYGIVPNALEVVLEPDLSQGWSANSYANVTVAAKNRLNANGYFPDFIGPSGTNTSSTTIYYNANRNTLKQNLDVLSYHLYAGLTSTNLQALATLAKQDGLVTEMLEMWTPGMNPDTFYMLMTDGEVSGVQTGVMAYTSTAVDSSPDIFRIDNSNLNNPIVKKNKQTELLEAYTYYVREGAQRIETQSNNSNFRSVAFVNVPKASFPYGQSVVVIHALSGGTVKVPVLTGGAYGIRITTSDVNWNQVNTAYLPDQVKTAGEILQFDIPSRSIVTVFQKTQSIP